MSMDRLDSYEVLLHEHRQPLGSRLEMTKSLCSYVESLGSRSTRALLLAIVSSCARGSQVPATPGDTQTTPREETGSQPAGPAELKLEQLADQPILTTGHGAFFDRNGVQIPVTLAFVDYAQRYYRDQMVAALGADDKRAFAAFEQRANASGAKGQDQLVLQNESLEWLLAALPDSRYKQQVAPKLRALAYSLNWVVPERADLEAVKKQEVFTKSPELQKRLEDLRGEREKKAGGVARLATSNFGQAYIDQCKGAGVPIPPSINVLDPNGTAGWKSQGFIPQALQFIVGTPAELRSWKSASPEGMCYALPRYTDSNRTTVSLDGVICIGKQSSHVCFWDNQMASNPAAGNGVGFSFGATEVIPIGVPSAPGGRYQAGGKEIEFGNGGVCTDCHAGENPYIVHPDANLGTVVWGSLKGPPQNLPTTGVNRYVPIVGASWPQNALSQAGSTLPNPACSACHTKASAGRLPHLSNQLPGYCGTVLTQAITKTMPQGSPGSATQVANAFRNQFCGAPPQANAADAGDPHLTTLNGVHFDFQAAGEFILVRNPDTPFEVQVRQTPVLTTFGPVSDPYTGLNSCVSVNTAVALQIGKHRLSYESSGAAFAQQGELSWYVDGAAVPSAQSIVIEGLKVNAKEKGPIELALSDGTRVIVNPVFWSSQGVWYLDVTVLRTTAREGIIGPLLPGEWLPRPPNGKSFGAMPGNLNARHTVLNVNFADSWRVSKPTSLFSYPAGLGTDAFTDRNWPPPPGKPCTSSSIKGVPTVREQRPDLAQVFCQGIKDKDIFADCVFDVTTMGGDQAIADAHKLAEKLLQ